MQEGPILHRPESPERASIPLERPWRDTRQRRSRRRGFTQLNWIVLGVVVMFMEWAPQPGSARDFVIGRLEVGNPRLAAPREDENRAPLSMAIHNNGDTSDTLVSVTSQRLGKAVLRILSTQLVPPKGILIPPHAAVLIEPRRPLVMFQDVSGAILADREKITLFFEKAGELTIEAIVEPADSNRAHGREATGAGEIR
jgi:copper(I)-binding protein